MASSQQASFDEIFDSFPSVKELIKEPTISIPKHYLRPDQKIPASFESNPFAKIPIIDLSLLDSVETTDLELEKLHSAGKEWGFFQKMKYKLRQGDVEGYGSIVRPGAKGDWGDRFFMVTNPIHRRKPYLFPELPSSLRNNMEWYILELQSLGKRLLGYMAKALNIEPVNMEMFDNGMQSIRMTYYPPCPQPELVLGLPPHSDGSGITILNQLNGVDGLQIKKDGVWIPVHFVPDALVVNVGDILEILSNGAYKSIEHMATINSDRKRISVAFFINPKFEAEVGPANILINQQNPQMYRRIGMEQFVKGFFSRTLDGKSFVDQMKIKIPEAGNSP